MSENYGSFDPDDAVLGGFLDGREGEVKEAVFEEFTYPGGAYDPVNRLSLTIVRDDGEERTEGYGIGKCKPADDGNRFIGNLNRASRMFKLVEALKKSGFPIKKLNEEGAAALVGARFNWTHVPVKGSDNSYAVPSKYLGGETAEDSDFKDELKSMVVEVVNALGTVKKTKLLAALKPVLENKPYASKATSLVLNDEFLGSIEGVSYADGVLTV